MISLIFVVAFVWQVLIVSRKAFLPLHLFFCVNFLFCVVLNCNALLLLSVSVKWFSDILEGDWMQGRICNSAEPSLLHFPCSVKNVVVCPLRFPGVVLLPHFRSDMVILLNFDFSHPNLSSVWALSWLGAQTGQSEGSTAQQAHPCTCWCIRQMLGFNCCFQIAPMPSAFWWLCFQVWGLSPVSLCCSHPIWSGALGCLSCPLVCWVAVHEFWISLSSLFWVLRLP